MKGAEFSLIIKKDISFSELNVWSGAVNTKEVIANANKADDFEQFIEELYPDGINETELNDLLWFDDEYLFEILSIK